MATKNDSIEQRNDDADDSTKNSTKKQAFVLSTFTKYSVLVPELRKPIIDYSTLTTLKKYAECSKLCSSEVRSLKNTIAPIQLEICGTQDSIKVMLHYKTTSKTEIFHQESTKIRDVEEYVMKVYRGVNRGRTVRMLLTLKEWPGRVMKIRQLTSFDRCRFILNKNTFKHFLEFAKTTTIKVLTLDVHAFGEEQTEIVLPREFFRTNLMKNVTQFVASVPIDVAPGDLLNNSIMLLRSNRWMNLALIQEIILKHNEINSQKSFSISVELHPHGNQEFNFDVVLPANRFPSRILRQNFCQIGSVWVTISNDKKTLQVNFYPQPR